MLRNAIKVNFIKKRASVKYTEANNKTESTEEANENRKENPLNMVKLAVRQAIYITEIAAVTFNAAKTKVHLLRRGFKKWWI